MAADHLKPLLAYIEFCFPEAFEEIDKHDLINPHLFSPFVLEIPKKILPQIKQFVKLVYEIKEEKKYQNELSLPVEFHDWPTNESILTCFDFHYSEDVGLKLIEINTNASLYLPLVLQRCAQADVCEPPQMDDLLKSFVKAFNLKPKDRISIFDEQPEKEGLFFEFLIFKEWLTRQGYPTNIISLDRFASHAESNIYNRYTDFYFSSDKSQAPREAYYKKQKMFSPNPREYALLADKRRLNVLRNHLLEKDRQLAGIIPETRLFSEFESKDDLWSQRKKYFFKPSKGYGSKGAFAGKSISKKAFEALYTPDFIAQEYCPAGKRQFHRDDEEFTMKFDLRFFTFAGEVQNYGARLYQGQTTNMKTQWGGLAPIRFI